MKSVFADTFYFLAGNSVRFAPPFEDWRLLANEAAAD